MAGTTKKKEEEVVTFGDGFADVKLSRPMQVMGAPVEALRMREPTVRDSLAADAVKGSDIEKEIGLFANLCELTPDQIKALPMRDYKRLTLAYLGFTD